jgi:UDP-N-acetyl-D-galactosamine dehydrogenase
VPGLVGGHCIGIDPYYLVHKSQSVGHNMGILKATRNINDSMGFHIANEIILLSAQKNIAIPGSRALLMGVTFKENCPDVRNSKPLDIKKELERYNMIVDVYDPVAKPAEMKKFFDIDMVTQPQNAQYDIIIIAVMHDEFKKLSIDQIRAFGKNPVVIYDIKSIFPKKDTNGRL